MSQIKELTLEQTKMAYERIMDILCEFDFERMHTIMEYMNWTWGSWQDEDFYDHCDEVPNIYALKVQAKKLMLQALEKQCGMATAGFEVCFGDPDDFIDNEYCYMALKFVALENSV